MGQLVLLVVAAAWAAVLIPPLLRSRIENRPNSSVTDFRNQLSSLQKALPHRSVTVRSMGRPLVPPPPLPPPPSPLRRPAAAGRPVLRSGVRTHQRTVQQSTLPAPQPRTPPPLPAEVHSRTHGSGARAADRRRHRPAQATSPAVVDDGVKRRRANILFVLVLVAGCALFLAATMQEQTLYYVAGAAFVGLCAYVYLLVKHRKREIPSGRRPAPVPPRLRRDEADEPLSHRRAHRPTVRYEERPARTRRGPAEERHRSRPPLPDVPGEPTGAILRPDLYERQGPIGGADEPTPRRRPRPRPSAGARQPGLFDEPAPPRRRSRSVERIADPRPVERQPAARRPAPARRGDAVGGPRPRHGTGAAPARRERWSQAG